MGYRIHFLRDDWMMGNIAAEEPLSKTLEDAVDLMPLFKADRALILDEVGHLVERIKCSAPSGSTGRYDRSARRNWH